MAEEPIQPTIAEAENSRGSAEPNTVAPVEETVPAEIVNMPNAPVTENSEPKVIEVESEPIVEETSEALPEAVEPPMVAENDTLLPTPAESVKTEELPVTEMVEKAILDTTSEEKNPDIYTVRTPETGDKVYAVKDKKRYWIKNPETLAKMGFYLGKEKQIPFSELLGYSEGEPIDLTIPNAIYPWDKPEQPKSTEPTNPTEIWQ